MPAGYVWTLREDQGRWRWTVLKREGADVVDTGLARSRPEGAACLVRAIARNTIAAESRSRDTEVAA